MDDFGKLNFSVSFKPTSAFPLDSRYYFSSLEQAQLAAQQAVPIGSADGSYYIGQNLVVVQNDDAKLYLITPGKTLKEVAGGSSGPCDCEAISTSDIDNMFE